MLESQALWVSVLKLAVITLLLFSVGYFVYLMYIFKRYKFRFGRDGAMQNTERFPVGYKYHVIENGKRVEGVIVSDSGRSYRVRWSDGQVTVETEIDPAT